MTNLNDLELTKDDLLPSLVTNPTISDWLAFLFIWTILTFLVQAPFEILAQWILLHQ